MEQLAFAPMIDLPLAGITLSAFIWHFNRWAFHHDIDTSIDVASRLPVARLRVIALFVCALLVCWLANFAFWSIFALLLGIGMAVALVAGGDVDGGAFGLWAAAYLIREWSFGFPQLVLHPQTHDTGSIASAADTGELVGKSGVTTSPLRPTGDAEIDGVTYSVASADGQLLDSGARVTVTSYRNGRPCVSPMPEPRDEG